MAPTEIGIKAKPGDLIEIFRGTYKHWAVYIGGNEVVHLIPPSRRTNPDDSGAWDLLTFLDSSSAEVRREKLWDVVGFDRFEVNNHLDNKYDPRERGAIVRQACGMVGQVLPYSVATNNCEHFVNELRYGRPQSRQVQTAAVIGGVAAVAVLGAALFSTFLKDDSKEKKRKQRKY